MSNRFIKGVGVDRACNSWHFLKSKNLLHLRIQLNHQMFGTRCYGTHYNHTVHGIHLLKQIIGIHGMGGIGKTTLASADNQISHEFGGRHTFLAVQQFSDSAVEDQHRCDLLQKILLVLCGITALDSSKQSLQKKLCDQLTRSKPVLLVLDNIWTVGQLDDILPAQLQLPAGSRVLITTCSEEIASGRINFQPQRVDLLQPETARQLLLLYAMPPASAAGPSQLDEVSTSRVLHACHGLPLALTVVGKYLLGQPTSAWQVCTSFIYLLSNLATCMSQLL